MICRAWIGRGLKMICIGSIHSVAYLTYMHLQLFTNQISCPLLNSLPQEQALVTWGRVRLDRDAPVVSLRGQLRRHL